jgi:hypothetical protein
LIQGEGQILTFQKILAYQYRCRQTATDCSVSWTQLYLGTSVDFLNNKQTNLPHMPGCWLKSLQTFLASIDVCLPQS